MDDSLSLFTLRYESEECKYPKDLLTLAAAFAEAWMWLHLEDTWVWLLAQHITSERGTDEEVKVRNISPPTRNHLPPALGVESTISGSRADIVTAKSVTQAGYHSGLLFMRLKSFLPDSI